MKLEDIEFQDAVFSIPKNAVKVKLEIESYETDGLQTLHADFGPQDIREAFQMFDDTVSGKYPKYVITEEGKKYLEQLREDV